MKNKTQKSIISTILVLVLVVGCFAALPLMTSAASAPVPGEPGWDVKYKAAKVIAPSLGPAADIPNNPRDNASGDKITSNAHSADYPGLYFYWDDKQKDNGVLLVSDWVFDLFAKGEFILTAKNSNNYWGYTITPDDGQLIDGVYAYGINKQIKYNEVDNKGKVSAKVDDLKNINMVFIDGQYKDGQFKIVKNWFYEEGIGSPITCPAEIGALNDDLKFNNGYGLGLNNVKITDYATAVNGKKVTVTETVPAGYFEMDRKSSQTITVQCNDDPIQIVAFNNQKQYAEITVYKQWIFSDETTSALIADAQFTVTGDFVKDEYPYANKIVYTVKAGTYTIVENAIKGFTLIDITGLPEKDIDIDIDGRCATVTVVAGGKACVTFVNQEEAKINPPGFKILKTVNGFEFDMWLNGYDGDVEELFAGVSFELQHAEFDNGRTRRIDPAVVMGDLDIATGVITFDIDFNEDLNVRRGIGDEYDSNWYAIVETFVPGSDAEKFFKQIDKVYFEVSATGRLITNFDFAATYTIVNGYTNQYIKNLQYGQNSELLDANGNIFYIGVNGVNKDGEAVVYDSFCAHANSKRFAGDNGLNECSGYIVTLDDVDGKFDKDVFLAAYNYIEYKYGSVNDNRVITQVVTWILLGAIDVKSAEFADANLTADERDAVIDVMDNYMSHKGNGPIVDIAYMVCETHGLSDEGLEWCQPQLVPIYDKVEIRNTPRPVTEIVFQKWINNVDETVGANFRFVILDSDDSVLATVYTDADGIGYHNFGYALPEGVYTIREDPAAGFEPQVDVIQFAVDANGAVTYIGFPDGNAYFVNIPVTPGKYAFRVVTSTEDVKDSDSRNHGTEINEKHPLDTGPDVKDVWNSNLEVWGTTLTKEGILYAMQAVVQRADGGDLTWTWNEKREQTQTAIYLDGDEWEVVYDDLFWVGENIANNEAWIYFGADDAVIIMIDGKVVAWSFTVLGGDPTVNPQPDRAELEIQYPLGEFQKGLKVGDVPVGGFSLYAFNLAPYLTKEALNSITIIALNQDSKAPGSEIKPEGNPCGLLLTFEVLSYDGNDNPW